MRLFKKDLTSFEVLKLDIIETKSGDTKREYIETNDFFEGNLQPANQNNFSNNYGVTLKYDFTILTTSNLLICEMDIVKSENEKYKIVTIQDFKTFKKLFVERIVDFERTL